MSQPVSGPHGELFAAREHGSTVLKPIDHKKRERFLERQKKNPKIKEREHYGYAVHGDHVVYIPKNKRGMYKELRENQKERGGKYKQGHVSGEHRKQHEERKKNRRVKHPILGTLAEACKPVAKEKKEKHDFPASPWLKTTFQTFFDQLSALHTSFDASQNPFDAKPPGKVWPKELSISSIAATTYEEFGKEKRRLFSELKKLIGPSQQSHTLHAGELRQAQALAEKNSVEPPKDSDPRPLDLTLVRIVGKEGIIVLPRKNKALRDKIIAKCIEFNVLNRQTADTKLEDLDVLNGIREKLPAGVVKGLLADHSSLEHIVKLARDDKKRHAKRMARSTAAEEDAAKFSTASEARAPLPASAAGAAPSLVSMLYHR
jgi:hypothetical protein